MKRYCESVAFWAGQAQFGPFPLPPEAVDRDGWIWVPNEWSLEEYYENQS